MLETAPAALDRLVRSDPWQLANFVLSSSIVRESAVSAGEALMVLPERGSLPIYWAADGYSAEESPISRDGIIRPPIGSFDFEAPDGAIRKGTLNDAQKQTIVGRYSQQLSDSERILVIDEVQKGGTITELVGIIENHREEGAKKLYVIAAQDSRRKVAAEPKKDLYQKMVSGNREGVSTTVVPMSLIATDRDSLLNQLWYQGSTRVPQEYSPEIEIRPNEEAELIFRTLGMVARNREALEDTSILDRNVFSFALGERASTRVEQWRDMLIDGLLQRVT